MVKKTGGGNKHKKKKNNTVVEIERELLFKTEDQEYAQVTKLLGNCRLEAQCFDGKNRLCHIRGTMRKKIWIVVNDVVLVSLRDYEDNKCDIIYKYTPKEVNKLKHLGEIPDSVKLTEDLEERKDDDLGIDFEEDEEILNIDEI
jgi:translation initiation factor 1A